MSHKFLTFIKFVFEFISKSFSHLLFLISSGPICCFLSALGGFGVDERLSDGISFHDRPCEFASDEENQYTTEESPKEETIVEGEVGEEGQ